jgi:hypothetical protein
VPVVSQITVSSGNGEERAQESLHLPSTNLSENTDIARLARCLGPLDRSNLSLQSSDFVAYLMSKQILEGTFGEYPVENLDESRTFTLSNGTQGIALRIRTLAPSALAETGALIAVLDELKQLPHIGTVVPEVLGLAVLDGSMYAVVEDFANREGWAYIGGALESRWSALNEKHPEMARQFKLAFSSAAIERMEGWDSIDIKSIGFENLRVDPSGKLRYQIDFSKPQAFIDLVAHGEIFNISGLAEDSFTLRGRVQAPNLLSTTKVSNEFAYPIYLVRNERDLDLVSYPDEKRRYSDIAQNGKSFISYSERPCDPTLTELTEERMTKLQSLEEALIFAGRRYNKERGREFSKDEQSIGYETAIILAILQAKDGSQLLAWCPVPGEDTEVQLTPGFEALKAAFPAYDPILFQSIHTHELLPYHSPTVQHSVDQRCAVHGLLPNSPKDQNLDAANSWPESGAAILDEVVYFRKEGLVVPPKSEEHATLEGTDTAVGCETLPLFLNGNRFPNGPTEAEKQLILEAVRDLESLKNDSMVIRAVAASLLDAVTTGNCQIGSCRIANSNRPN